MPNDLITLMAGNIFTSLFGGQYDPNYRSQLVDTKSCIEAMVGRRKLPATPQTEAFRLRTNETFSRRALRGDRSRVLRAVGKLIDTRLARLDRQAA